LFYAYPGREIQRRLPPARTGNPGNEMNVMIVNNPESIIEKKISVAKIKS
jgi:hypothetical protein